jgi:hypothetical protein
MRASSLSALVLLSAIVLSSSLGAQSSGRILGWSTDPSVTAPGQIHVQDILAKCPPAFPICNNAPNDPGTPTIRSAAAPGTHAMATFGSAMTRR